MSIFDINYNNKAIEWLPVDKRLPKIVAFVQALFSPIQWVRNKFLGDYRLGRTAPDWIQLGSPFGYSIGDMVMHKQVVYQSLTNDNIQEPPGNQWEMYLPSFLGADERVLFNGQKLVLEFALNQYFRTNYRQPGLLGYYYPANTPGTPTTGDANHLRYSDIFTLNNAKIKVGFLVGKTEDFCSTVAQHDAGDGGYSQWTSSNYTAGDVVTYANTLFLCIQDTVSQDPPTDKNFWHQVDAVGYSSPFILGDNFTIYVPAGIYALTNESEIRNLVNKIIPLGIIYNITTY